MFLADRLLIYLNRKIYRYRKKIKKYDVKKKTTDKTLYDYITKNKTTVKLVDKIDGIKILNDIKNKMQRAGNLKEDAYIYYIMIAYFIPLVLIVNGIVSNWSLINNEVLIGILISFSYKIIIQQKIKKHEDTFKREAYQIYKFLSNQISSGVRQIDAIRNVHKIVDDPLLKKRFQKLSFTFVMTYNIKKSMVNVTDYYHCFEAKSFATVIIQGMKTGFAENMIEIKEHSMFNANLNMVKMATEKIRFKALIIAVVLAAIILILLVAPIVGQLISAESQVFV